MATREMSRKLANAKIDSGSGVNIQIQEPIVNSMAPEELKMYEFNHHCISLMMFSFSTSIDRTQNERRWEPARKTRKQQRSPFTRFRCGICKQTFTTRFAQTRHLSNFHQKKKERKRQRKQDQMVEKLKKKIEIQNKKILKLERGKKPKGCPPHPYHYCNMCGEEFKTACIKRDHQR